MGLVVRPPSMIDSAEDTAIRVRAAELATAARARGPVDLWHDVGGTGEPAFGDSAFSDYGSGYNPVGFSKDPAGFIALRGVVAVSGVFTSDRTLFTLPAGYIPAYHETPVTGGDMQVNTAPPGSAPSYVTMLAAFIIQVFTDGRVVGGANVVSFLVLDNLRFRVPQ